MPVDKIMRKRMKRFSAKMGHKKKMVHFWDYAVNPLNPRSIFLFSGSVFVDNIIEKRVKDFHEIFRKYSWHSK